MSIKQSIASLVILLSVSFSAFSQLRAVTHFSDETHMAHKCWGLSVGDVVDPFSLSDCTGLTFQALNSNFEITSVYRSQSVAYARGTRDGRSAYGSVHFSSTVASCPDGQNINPETGKCEDQPFCSQESTQQQMRDYETQCFADGGSPTIVCNDLVDPPDFRMSCDIAPPPPEGCEPGSPSWPSCLDDENKCDENHPDWNPEYGMCCTPDNNWCDVPPPESCTIFSPNWPACSGDTDIDPPSGGDLGDPDKPDGGGSGGTDPDKPEPDVDNTSDTLAAIKAMNKDVNSQLTGINNDMNKNQAETKSALDALKASVDLNTDTVVDNANHVANAIQGQSDMLSDIGNKTNGLLTSANNLLNNGFGQLSNELGDLQSTNQKGFGDVVDALNELGNTDVTQGQGEAPVLLYDGTQYANLLSEVETLKGEYKQILNDFKSYFNFNDGVNSGDFNPHNLGLNWHGNAINQKNQVMLALQDNAGIISAVVLFIFGMLGIRALVGAL
ncbi:TPA: chemotaxis protein [Vibrio parahaemolyticus]|uniref:chemotaxis protein n=1 Tax=Vibrio parahaemolyticus TaxID=670 RepID=UPI00111E5DA6|nr:chemotaxis protein [Vibrio parahaemolyticus]TOP17755.1 chemotaxis protein [Vibrio parahaemolyticus]TOQ53776.1 chemotaxis protein [Vibrio parahaemolyticus]HCG5284688.1 chemotaxis protein [Vibrio parahaemolyticus]HCG7069940.1 chemotaxis protein [Vibrio parahaemolyticus]HCG7540923.1 chemotaxis protein [Vibrio parahaemolyticus]